MAGLQVPTLAEMTRIKAWLLVTRNTLRDYLETVVLLERAREAGARKALAPLDQFYPQVNGASPLTELVERLAAATPGDLAAIDLHTYRGLQAPWNDWPHVAARGRHWAQILAGETLAEVP